MVAGSDPTDNPTLFSGGDMIIAIDGVEVRDFNDMITYLVSYKSPGETVTLTILRGDQEMELELTLEKRP